MFPSDPTEDPTVPDLDVAPVLADVHRCRRVRQASLLVTVGIATAAALRVLPSAVALATVLLSVAIVLAIAADVLRRSPRAG